MIRDLVIHPDERLRAVSVEINDNVKALEVRADLLDTMASTGAHGLAAVQIGEHVRMFAIDEHKLGVKVYANPVLKEVGGPLKKCEEGCMSLPGTFGIVKRRRSIVVEVSEVTSEGIRPRVTLEIAGFAAVVWQHEIDHMDGVLFIDKLAEAKSE